MAVILSSQHGKEKRVTCDVEACDVGQDVCPHSVLINVYCAKKFLIFRLFFFERERVRRPQKLLALTKAVATFYIKAPKS